MKTMKKLRTILLVTLLFCSTGSFSQDYNTAVGLRFGESSGLTIKHSIKSGMLEFIISAWPNDLTVFGLYEKYKPPLYRTTKDTFEKDLGSLLEDEKLQKQLAVEGKTYVCNTHAVDKVVDIIEKYYR